MSNFNQWNNIAGHIFPIVIALFIGSWSDRRGRKLPLLLGLTGKLAYVLALLMNIRNGNGKLHGNGGISTNSMDFMHFLPSI